uniref:Guanine nucleotide-binding protein subunit beta-like protein n=1 Tax=Lotharella globosa TaxID=91324 RepID=A0A7S3YV59_9EUKA
MPTPCQEFDLVDKKRVRTFKGHVGDVQSIAIDLERKRFITGACDTRVKVWDLDSGSCTMTLPKISVSDVNSVAVSENGCIAAGNDSGEVIVWDANCEDSTVLKSTTPAGICTCVAISQDGSHVYGGFEENVLIAWEVESGKQTMEMKFTRRVSSIAASPDGEKLAIGSWSGEVIVLSTGLS